MGELLNLFAYTCRCGTLTTINCQKCFSYCNGDFGWLKCNNRTITANDFVIGQLGCLAATNTTSYKAGGRSLVNDSRRTHSWIISSRCLACCLRIGVCHVAPAYIYSYLDKISLKNKGVLLYSNTTSSVLKRIGY